MWEGGGGAGGMLATWDVSFCQIKTINCTKELRGEGCRLLMSPGEQLMRKSQILSPPPFLTSSTLLGALEQHVHFFTVHVAYSRSVGCKTHTGTRSHLFPLSLPVLSSLEVF